MSEGEKSEMKANLKALRTGVKVEVFFSIFLGKFKAGEETLLVLCLKNICFKNPSLLIDIRLSGQ